jgi:hypothetical protein
MAVQPPGAQVSQDGNYWWDEQAQQWQPVEGGAAQTETAASGSSQSDSGSDSEPAAGDEAQADVSIEGACLTSDVSDADIEQLLSAAGASLEDA